jgi:DnaK suppressor protein
MLRPAMYNPALFSIRQELLMPAKKTASKKQSKATTSRKKVSARKVSKKKVTTKKVAKKAVAKKQTGKKKPSSKKISKKVSKKTPKKTPKKKSSKKSSPSKKKAARKTSTRKSSKKSPSRKAPKKTTKKSTKKSASKKKAGSKKGASKKVSKKKTSSKKTVVKKASKKKASKKKAIAQKSTTIKSPPKRSRSRGDVLTGPIHGIEPYKTRRGEEYMSEGQLEHFRKILTAWKRELMFEVDRTVHHMQDEAANFPDPNDRATQESEFGLELRTRDRERKLLRKIEAALSRIDDGSYGFCDETGEEIGLKRLEARPVATLCLEAQERREVAERQFRDRDDRYR